MPGRRPIAMLAAVGLAAAATVAAVQGSAAAGSTPGTLGHLRRAVSTSASMTTIIGGSVAEGRLLRRILATLGPTPISRLRIVAVPGGVRLQAPVTAISASWDVEVLGAVFHDRSRDQQLPAVLEVDLRPVGFPTSDLQARPPAATPASAAATRRAMRRIALASGARGVELRVSRPDALAVALRLRVVDAAKFLHHRLRALVLKARAHEARYEGLLIQVDDAHGIAWASGETRLGGESYVRPSLSGCNPFPPPGPGPAPGIPVQQSCPG